MMAGWTKDIILGSINAGSKLLVLHRNKTFLEGLLLYSLGLIKYTFTHYNSACSGTLIYTSCCWRDKKISTHETDCY